MAEIPRKPMTVRKEVWAIVIGALIIGAVFVIHPIIQKRLTTAPEASGTSDPARTDAKEPAQNPPASASGQ